MIAPRSPHGRRHAARCAVAIGALLAALAGAAPALGAPAPHWTLESRPAPTNLPPGGEAQILATATNLGDAEVNGEASAITLSDALPAGLEVLKVEEASSFHQITTPTGCSAPSAKPSTCTFERKLAPYEQLEMYIRVKVNSPPAKLVNEVTVSGGGLPEPPPLIRPLTVSSEPTPFGVEEYELTPENEDGSLDTEAGSHPFQLTTTFALNEARDTDGLNGPSSPALARNLSFQLPPGLLGNANVLGNLKNAVNQCSGPEFGQLVAHNFQDSCPADTAVGVAAVTIDQPFPPGYGTFIEPVFNLAPPPGEPAQFGFDVAKVPVVLNTSLRTGGDYGVTVSVENTSQAVDLLSSRVTIWGVPTDPVHNLSRGWVCLDHYSSPGKCEETEEGFKDPEPAPLLTLPTSCQGRLATTVTGESWPNAETGKVSRLGENGEETTYRFPTPLTGCCELPASTRRPKSNGAVEEANTPTGLSVHVHVPQQPTLEFEGTPARWPSRRSRTRHWNFPKTCCLSPSAANGLEACAEGETEPPGGVGFTGNGKLEPGTPITPVHRNAAGTAGTGHQLLRERLEGRR